MLNELLEKRRKTLVKYLREDYSRKGNLCTYWSNHKINSKEGKNETGH